MDKKIETVIDKLTPIKDQYWGIHIDTAQFLHFLVHFRGIRNILEIGTSIGYSTLWFAEGVKKSNGKIVTIESNDERFNKAAANFKEAEVDDIIFQIKGHAPEILDEVDLSKIGIQKFDMILLDATKVEYIDFLNFTLPLLNKNGIIIADNAHSHAEVLKDYKNFIFNSPLLKSVELSIGTGVFMSVKI